MFTWHVLRRLKEMRGGDPNSGMSTEELMFRAKVTGATFAILIVIMYFLERFGVIDVILPQWP